MILENILNKALSLRPSERAILAQKLIVSLSAEDDSIEQEWLELAEKRFDDLKKGKVRPKTWKEIRNAVTKH